MDLRFFAKLTRKTITDKWELYLIDRLKVIAKVGEVLGKQDETEKLIQIVFKENDLKTREELGYFHAEVLPKLQMAYQEVGYPVWNQESTKELLKRHVVYIEIVDKIHPISRRIYKEEVVKSFAKIGKKEMAKVIDYAIMICLEAGIEVETPEQYKNKQNGSKQ